MSLIAALTGCTDIFLDVPELVVKTLNEKYGEEFVATSIGNRWNTGRATVVCHPQNDENMNFQAVYDYSTKEVSDNYKSRKFCRQFDEELSASYKEKGYECTSFTQFVGGIKGYPNMSKDTILYDYIHNSEMKEIFISISVALHYIIVEAGFR